MTVHPVAALFPMLPEPELRALADDTRAHGQQLRIVVQGDVLLDGRNRLRACEMAGVEPLFTEYGGDDPAAFIISANLHRRHLNTGQRALIAAGLATLTRADAGALGAAAQGKARARMRLPEALTQEQAATRLNVSERTLQEAKAVAAASPKLAAEVREGRRTLRSAMREVKKAEVAVQVSLPEARYRVLYADPPWSYGNTQPDYHPEQRDHYPVMSLAQLCAMDIRSICEDNAVLFLWVTSPMLEECFQVVRAWSFRYVSSFVWDKVKHNMGHYNSVRHEFLLVCVRGSCQPDVPRLFDSVLTVERTEHSRKPAEVYDIIDTLYPQGRRLELFARGAHPGWDAYGYEAALP